MQFIQHHPILFIVASVFIALCMLTLMFVAEARGQTRWHAVWGLLGLPGMALGLLIMLALPSGPTQPPSPSAAAMD